MFMLKYRIYGFFNKGFFVIFIYKMNNANQHEQTILDALEHPLVELT